MSYIHKCLGQQTKPSSFNLKEEKTKEIVADPYREVKIFQH